MIIGKNGQSRCMPIPAFSDPSSDRFCHAADFGIGATLDVIVALKFKGDMVWPAVRALDKTVIERGHGSWGIYTKSLSTAAFPGTLGMQRMLSILWRLSESF